MLTSISEITKKCLFCSLQLLKGQKHIDLECGHAVCIKCAKVKAEAGEKTMICNMCQQEKNVLIGELKFLEIFDKGKSGTLKCDIHQHEIEYFQKSAKKFACMKCLAQFLQADSKSEELVQVNQEMINKDLMRLKVKLGEILKDLELKLKRGFESSKQLSLFFSNTINFINNQTQTQIESQLDIFKAFFNKSAFQSTIRNSKIFIPPLTEVKQLVGFSKIITQPEQENFLHTLFDKKF